MKAVICLIDINVHDYMIRGITHHTTAHCPGKEYQKHCIRVYGCCASVIHSIIHALYKCYY